MLGGQKIFSGGEVGFNKIVFGFLLNQPPAANQNSTKVHLSTLTNNCNMKQNCCRSPWLSEISMVGWGDNTIIINRVMSKITLIPSLNMFLWPKLSQRIKKKSSGVGSTLPPPLENWARNPKITHFSRFSTFPLSPVWSPNYWFLSLQPNSKVVKQIK